MYNSRNFIFKNISKENYFFKIRKVAWNVRFFNSAYTFSRLKIRNNLRILEVHFIKLIHEYNIKTLKEEN